MNLFDRLLKWQNKSKKPGPIPQNNSHAGPMIAFSQIGRPVWTSRNFDTLTEEGYKKNVIVYRSVNLISRAIASVPWRLYQGRSEMLSHVFLDLLHGPNPRQGGSAFMETLASYLLLSGNSYMEVLYNNEQIPSELHLLRPDRVKIIPGADGTPYGYDYTASGRSVRLDAYHAPSKPQIIHFKLFNPLDDWYGMSPIEAAAASIDQHNAVGAHNLSILQNGGRPTGALIIGGQDKTYLTDEQRETLKQDIRDLYEGAKNAGRILVMEGGFEWKEMGLSPKDLDFVEGKNTSAREIAKAYGVPSMLVGVPGDATFSNYREARLHLWEDTILPLLDHITDEINRHLAPSFGPDMRIGYDIDQIPALSARREETWSKIASASFLTINEKRHAIGYAPIDGGDLLQPEDKHDPV